jgi:hypothetical protein
MSAMDDFMGWCFDRGILGMIVFAAAILAVCAVVIAPFVVWDASQPHFSLRKDQWACTAAHDEVTSGGYFSGKVWIPTTSVSRVCDQWSRAR